MIMDFSISVTDAHKQTALNLALDAYNRAHGYSIDAPSFMQKLIDGQLDGLVKAYLVTNVTKLAFLNRFTSGERIGIRAAATQSPAIADYLAMLDAAQDVDLTDARTIGGVQALEAGSLIAAGRAAQILTL
jgi:hypothetical protein